VRAATQTEIDDVAAVSGGIDHRFQDGVVRCTQFRAVEVKHAIGVDLDSRRDPPQRKTSASLAANESRDMRTVIRDIEEIVGIGTGHRAASPDDVQFGMWSTSRVEHTDGDTCARPKLRGGKELPDHIRRIGVHRFKCYTMYGAHEIL
jgi:hypothetical protein